MLLYFLTSPSLTLALQSEEIGDNRLPHSESGAVAQVQHVLHVLLPPLSHSEAVLNFRLKTITKHLLYTPLLPRLSQIYHDKGTFDTNI